MKKIITLISGTLLAASFGAYAILDSAVPAGQPTVWDFDDLNPGSMPDYNEPIDLAEYPGGAGNLVVFFAAPLELNSNAPVTLSYDGTVIGSVTLVDGVNFEPFDMGGIGGGPLAAGDDVDPGMTQDPGMRMVTLDFMGDDYDDPKFTQEGLYTVTFPHGLFKFADGSIVSEGSMFFNIEHAAVEPQVIDFEDVLAIADPMPGEPLEVLSELAIGFSPVLVLNEACQFPVTLSHNGEVVASLEVGDEGMEVLDMSGAAGMSDDDDLDPGFGVSQYQTVLNLTFDEFTEAGDYTLNIPRGLLKFENGDLVSAGELVYTVEGLEMPVQVAYDVTPRPYDEGLENSVESLTRFTLAVSDLDYSSLTVNEEEAVAFVKAGEKFYPLTLATASATSVTLSLPFPLYTPGSYELVVEAGSLTATQLDGKETPLQKVSEEYVIAEGAALEFEALLAQAEPDFRETVDLNQLEGGFAYANFVLNTHLSKVAGSEANIQLKKGTEVVATCDIEVMDDSLVLPSEDDTDPGMSNAASSILVVNFGVELTEAGTYTLVIPDGLFWANNCPVTGAEIEYTLAASEIVDFESVIAGADPMPGEELDGFEEITLAFAAKLQLNDRCAKKATLSYKGAVIAELSVDEIELMDMSGISPLAEGDDDDVDPGMGVDMYQTVVVLNFGEYTEGGEYTVSLPEGLFKFENGDLVGAYDLVYDVDGVVVPTVVAYDITPRPYDEGLENEVESLTRFTLAVSDLDYKALTVSEDAEAYLVVSETKHYPLTIAEATATSVTLSLPFPVYVPGTYTLEVTEGSLTATQLDNTVTPLQEISEEYVIAEGQPIDFEDLLAQAEPDFRETIDVAEEGNENGLSWVNFFLNTHLAKVEGSEAAVTLSLDNEKVATGNVEVIDNSLVLPTEDDVDPGMSDPASSILAIDFEKEIKTAGTYLLNIPSGLLWANNCPVIGAEIEYILVDSSVGVQEVLGGAKEYTVTDLQGRTLLVNASADQVNALGAGLYIVNGLKVVKK